MSPRLFLPLLAAALVAACPSPNAAPPVATPTQPAPAAAAQATTSKVAKVVFVGKKEACDCTRKAIDASRTALTAVLGAQSPILVEEILSDVEGARVEPYRMLKPYFALPALYFVDARDGIVNLLQGEVSEAQIKAAL